MNVKCVTCNGTGVVVERGDTTTCDACDGRGFVWCVNDSINTENEDAE